MKRIQSKDKVIVIAGKSKGHIGEVTKVDGDRVFVSGANLIHKTVKPNPNLNIEGGIVTKEASIHVSNVAIYNSQTKKADKVGFKIVEQEKGKPKKVRIFRSNQEIVGQI